MFRTREDNYRAKTFETQDEALDFIKTVSAELKKEGFTIMNMNVREVYGYGGMGMPMSNNGSIETEPEGYVGSVEAKKDAPVPAEETEASTPSVN